MGVDDELASTVEIQRLLTWERQAHDRGWWAELADCYQPDAVMETSWFSGPVHDYISRSREMAATDPAQHRLGQPVIRVRGHRAVAEMPMTIEFRGEFHGVEVDLIVQVRFLHRVERHDGRWRLVASHAVFERDTVNATLPGAEPDIDIRELAGLRPSYRLLTLWMTERGHDVGADRLGTDRPEEVDRLYRDAYVWAGLSLS